MMSKSLIFGCLVVLLSVQLAQGVHHSLSGLSDVEVEEIRQMHSGTHGPPGSVIGDPHFTAYNGVLYDFQGAVGANLWYAIASSRDTQLNALLGQDFLFPTTTVMRSIGLVSGGDTISINVAVGADGRGDVGVTANGAPFPFGSSVTLPGGTTLSTTGKTPGTDVGITIRTPSFEFDISNPTVRGADPPAWYDRLDLGSSIYTYEAHGVLGQTINWAAGRTTIDGVDGDYVTGSQFGTSFRFSYFGTPGTGVIDFGAETPVATALAEAADAFTLPSGPVTGATPAATPAPVATEAAAAPIATTAATPAATTAAVPAKTSAPVLRVFAPAPAPNRGPRLAPAPGPSSGLCADIAPSSDFTCAQQLSFGKCNEAFMAGFCNASCGRCKKSTTASRKLL